MQTLQQIITSLTAIVMALSAQVGDLSEQVHPTSQLAQVAPTSGLVAHYKFDEGSGTIVSDSAGGNTATLVNGPTWTTGKIGQGLDISVSNQYINTASDFIGTNPTTACVWLKLRTAGLGGGQAPIIYNAKFTVKIASSNRFLSNSDGVTNAVSATNALPYNTWTHICVTRDGSGIANLYANGLLTGTPNQNSGTPAAGASIRIGGNAAGQAIDGIMDDVRIYNRVLSASEISDIYNDTGSTPSPTPVNGQCGTTQNSCTAGTLNDIADTSSNYLWQCAGTNGGTTASCSLPIPPPPPTDTTPPSIPTNLTATAVSSSQINLSWSASTDTVGVTGYRIYRGGTQVGTSVINSYSDTGLNASTAYSYTVSAQDAAGNTSSQSSTASATTQAPAPTPPTISFFTSSPSTITSGNSATLSWSVTGNPTPVLSITPGNPSTSSGSVSVAPTLTTTYTLTATNSTGSTTAQTTVTVSSSSSPTGNDIYISQNGAGTQNGSNCSNAKPVSFFNTASNWGTGIGQIGPSKTVHLCGTISTTLTIHGSGLSGSPVTIFFESGAKLSKTAWGINTSSAIYAYGKNNIVIDGGINGVIENTDNGTGLGNSINSTFIEAAGNPSGWEVKNLTFSNMYVRTEGAETNAYGTAAAFRGILTNISFHHNVVHDGNKVVMFSWYGGASSNINVYNNTISNSAVAITVGSGNSNSSINNVQIYNNDLSRGLRWSGAPAIHTDLTHVYAVHANTQVTGLKIYNNYYHGVCGTNTTTDLFGEGPIINPLYFNNVFVTDANPGTCSNGMIYLKADINPMIANNTFHSVDADTQTAMYLGAVSGAIIKNNLFSNIRIAIGPFTNANSVSESDYNLFSPNDLFLNGSWATINLSAWRAAHPIFETNSNTGNQLLDANLRPQTGSAAINAGTNLSSYFATDKSGNQRPTTGSWDIGAYEYQYGGFPPPPPPTYAVGDFNHDGLVNSIDLSLLSSKWLQSYSSYDLQPDGLINSLDFAIMSSNWSL